MVMVYPSNQLKGSPPLAEIIAYPADCVAPSSVTAVASR